MRQYLQQVIRRQNLSEKEMTSLMEELMAGNFSDVQIAGFLVALTMKGISPQELAAAADIMQRRGRAVDIGTKDFVDIMSTGGTSIDTFNISTASMLVTAGAGVTVAKHGTRRVSSKCGSGDVLQALGMNVNLPADHVSAIIRKLGVCFLFAPELHPAMKFASPSRRGLGVPTIFHLLGPMVNPAGAEKQLIGVFSKDCQELMAGAFSILKAENIMLVHGEDGVDEISITGDTHVVEIQKGELNRYTINPKDLGLDCAKLEDIKGGRNVEENATILRKVVEGEKGPRRDVVLLNSAAAIKLAGEAKDLEEGLEKAKESIDSGKAKEKLELLIRYSKA